MGFVWYLFFDLVEWSWDVLFLFKVFDILIILFVWGFGMDWYVKVDVVGCL